MKYKVGFIGFGNMANAMAKGAILSGFVKSDEVAASSGPMEEGRQNAEKLGISFFSDNTYVSMNSELLILSVKPNILSKVTEEIHENIQNTTVVLSIVAGQTISTLENLFVNPMKLISAMPNTPALVGEGMTAYVCNSNINENEEINARSFLDSFGKVEKVEEAWMPAVVAASGSSPAYVALFLEALSDAAVKLGMPRQLSYKFAAQAVLGSAKLLEETEYHPGILKDMVCSPGGTTIEAVQILEEKGFRGTVIDGALAAGEKSKSM